MFLFYLLLLLYCYCLSDKVFIYFYLFWWDFSLITFYDSTLGNIDISKISALLFDRCLSFIFFNIIGFFDILIVFCDCQDWSSILVLLLNLKILFYFILSTIGPWNCSDWSIFCLWWVCWVYSCQFGLWICMLYCCWLWSFKIIFRIWSLQFCCEPSIFLENILTSFRILKYSNLIFF